MKGRQVVVENKNVDQGIISKWVIKGNRDSNLSKNKVEFRGRELQKDTQGTWKFAIHNKYLIGMNNYAPKNRQTNFLGKKQ